MAVTSTTTKQEFEQKVLKSDKLVLVDFWAEWCPPCRAMAPMLETLASDDSSYEIVKVNIEANTDNQALAADYEVQGIPNLQIFKDGKVIDRYVGMTPVEVLKEALDKHSK